MPHTSEYSLRGADKATSLKNFVAPDVKALLSAASKSWERARERVGRWDGGVYVPLLDRRPP